MLTQLHSLESYEPVFRGRKLVLNYTGGSLCPSHSSRALAERTPVDIDLGKRSSFDDDDEDDEDDESRQSSSSKDSERRKTAVISLLCESDPLAKTSISFVAAIDHCVYFFEGRSPHACGGVHVETQALGPGGVFGVIVLIAVLVYLVGGCVYQRTVMHQRGWRQLPNYHMWASIARFFFVRRKLLENNSEGEDTDNLHRTCSSSLPPLAHASSLRAGVTAVSRWAMIAVGAAGEMKTKTG